MKKQMTLLAAASLLAMATAASAANKAETFSLTPVVGGITFDGTQHLETRPAYGLRAGYNFTKALGIEALFDYANTKSTLDGSKKADFFRYGGELLYHFMPDNKFVPYVAAGFAGSNFKGAAAPLPGNKARGMFDYGLGAKYFFSDNVALRGDVRHLIYDRIENPLHAVEYTAGLYLPFGAPAPAAKLVEPAPAPKVEPAPIVKPAEPAPKVEPPADSDRDGVIDALDKCPGTPAGVKVDKDGCPLDSDHDGVPDYLDKCPNTPAGVKVDKHGCPPAIAKAIEKYCSKPAVVDVKFDTNKADIKTKYDSDLKVLGEFLKEFPKAKGEISGHTDNVGSQKYNQKLSERRADSVKKYLIQKYGIDGQRISTKGYGELKPVATNKTKEGKAQNRRIETNFNCE